MIINKELTASLDEPTQTVIMHRTEPTKLQTLTLQLSEKITTLMDQTERMIKGGEMSAFFQRNQVSSLNKARIVNITTKAVGISLATGRISRVRQK